MVVSKEILPSLVRATIINAERSIRDMRLRSLKSYHSRKKLIKQSIYDRVQAKLKESIGPEGYNINNLISTQNKLSSELFRWSSILNNKSTYIFLFPSQAMIVLSGFLSFCDFLRRGKEERVACEVSQMR